MWPHFSNTSIFAILLDRTLGKDLYINASTQWNEDHVPLFLLQ